MSALITRVLLVCIISLLCCQTAQAGGPRQEYVTTTPVLADGILYVASATYPDHRGHLRAIDLRGAFPATLWDAAERMPLPGTGSMPGGLPNGDPPTVVNPGNWYRSLFTNLDAGLLPFTPGELTNIEPRLAVASPTAATILLHAVRGRRGGTPVQPAGNADDPRRLWANGRSSPVLVGASPVNTVAAHRDRVLYAGGEDGMLHAFFAGHWNQGQEPFPATAAEAGAELWAYLPGTFLPQLKSQPLVAEVGALAVTLDGSPVVRELFLDLDGDGQRRWHTILVATGTLLQERRSNLFVLDVTDPYQPVLLWERLLPGDGVGRTRGVAMARCGSPATAEECLYLTTDSAAGGAAAAVHALALSLETGQLRWQFSAPYPSAGGVTEATPAAPVLMDLSGDKQGDSLVFGDLGGRLWVLDLDDGHAYGGAPVFVTPGGAAEPIGAGVTSHKRLVLFGTGGVAGAAENYPYAIYAVEILPAGGRLRWRHPLQTGEKVWAAPLLDVSGNVIFATAQDYRSLPQAGETATGGRMVALNEAGEEEFSHDLGAAIIGRVVAAPGFAVSVSLTGEVTQLGEPGGFQGPGGGQGSVKALSWRQR